MDLSGNSMQLSSPSPSGRPPRLSGQETNRFRRFARWCGVTLVSALIVGMFGLFIVPSMAQAAPKPTSSLSPDGTQLTSSQSYTEQCSQNDNGSTCVKGDSVTTSTQSGADFDSISKSTTATLEYVFAGGLSSNQPTGTCKWMVGGWNSGNGYRTENGKVVLKTGVWQDNTRQYVCHTGKGPSGWQVKKCGNYYWPKGMTPGTQYPRYKTVTLVKHLKKVLTGTVSAKTISKANGSSTSNADTQYCHAKGAGSYVAVAEASSKAHFRIVITERSQIKARLTSAFVKLALQQQAKATADAWAKASSKAQGEARSEASCKDVTPPTVTVTQPAQPVPTVTVTAPGATTTVTAPGTPGPTTTITAPGPTVTVTAPGTPGPTTTVTVPAPGPTVTITVPGTPGPATTVTAPVPGPTVTITKEVPGPEKTITVPGPEKTITVPGPEKTVTVPGPTVTVTVPGPTVTVTATPGTTPPSETPKPQAPTVNVERMNDQQVSTSTQGIKVSYSVAGGDSANVSIHANYGKISDVSQQSSVSGSGTITFTYTAPTEGTPDNTDTITVGITDTATGYTGGDATQFKILVPGTNASQPPL